MRRDPRGIAWNSPLNAAGEGICGRDETGRIMFINPAATRMLGYGAGALSGENFHHLVHHSCPHGNPFPAAYCPLTGVLRNGHTQIAGDEMFWRKYGTLLPVSYVRTPMLDADQPSGAVIAFRDITGERRTERALQDSERQLRLINDAVRKQARTVAMLATAMDCVIATNHEDRMLEVNPAAKAPGQYQMLDTEPELTGLLQNRRELLANASSMAGPDSHK